MKQQTKKQNIAQDMMVIANLKGFKNATLDFIRLLKASEYTKKEAIKYIPGYAELVRLNQESDLLVYWIKKYWRKL